MAGSTKKTNAKPAKAIAKPVKKMAGAQKPSAKKPVEKAKAVIAKPAVKPPMKPAAKKTVAVAAPAPRKTVAAAKPEPAKAPPKRKAPALTPKEIETITEELDAQRVVLEKELEDLDLGSLNIAQSELSGEVSFDEDYADAGTFTFERERDFSLSNNIRDLIDKVEIAKRRISDGTYGICERCGNAIDKARLKALPYSVLCISCKQQEERTR
ncbi:MAG: TraR/DksA family transcriptional regulator [Actinomycetota bacterium]